MKQGSTLFSHICLSRTQCPENWATDALHYILQNSASAAKAFLELAAECGANLSVLVSFESQHGSQECGIPDLSCRDESQTPRVVVESKFNAGLTKNQPSGYLKLLPSDSPGVVLFVVPRARKHFLWKQILQRCEGKITAEPKPTESMLWAELSGGHYVAITAWRTLLHRLETACADSQEPHRVNDIKQLQGLTDAMDIAAFVPMNECDTNVEVARRFNNYLDLPTEILDEAERQKLCTRKRRVSAESGFGNHSKGGVTAVYAGRYAEMGKVTAWLGFETRFVGTIRSNPDLVHFRGRECKTRSQRATRLVLSPASAGL
jgi:hypothetical protein